jgi:hypothetical protein
MRIRTTVAVDNELLTRAKRRARQRGVTLGEVIEAALRRDLASEDSAADRPPIPVFTMGTGPRPGIDLTSSRTIHEVLDEDLDLDRRR